LQNSNETFNEAWERFKNLLRQCPHHGFSELHQLVTFYNALNPNDQDALDSAAGSRVTDVRANANAPLSSSHLNSFDLQQIAAALEDKVDIRMNRFEKSLNKMKNSFITPTAPLKAVTESIALKRVLWEYISLLISRWDGETIVMGNFNKVRSSDERLGSVFNLSSARAFNSFISVSGLVDVKMEGYSFTWSHPSASKMSKLD
nr:RNA-directed DNA polymerase, eukaryota [Tanacetum cinerariifolium]